MATYLALASAFVACRADKGAARTDSTPQSTGRTGESATANAGQRTTPSTTASTARRHRVVILGTSLTAGLGLDPDKAYPALLQRKADSAGFQITVINAGLSGETSAGARRRAGWVLDQAADVVVLEVGANDGLRGVDPDSTRENIAALVKAVRTQQPKATVLLVQMEAPTNLGRDYTTKFHEAYATVSRDANVTLLPFLLRGVAGDARLNQADGIHPNIEGSIRVADTMWRALLPTLSAFEKPIMK